MMRAERCSELRRTQKQTLRSRNSYPPLWPNGAKFLSTQALSSGVGKNDDVQFGRLRFDYFLALSCCPSETAMYFAEQHLERDCALDLFPARESLIGTEFRADSESVLRRVYVSDEGKLLALVDVQAIPMTLFRTTNLFDHTGPEF
jgi:hypothetical protein